MAASGRGNERRGVFFWRAQRREQSHACKVAVGGGGAKSSKRKARNGLLWRRNDRCGAARRESLPRFEWSKAFVSCACNLQKNRDAFGVPAGGGNSHRGVFADVAGKRLCVAGFSQNSRQASKTRAMPIARRVKGSGGQLVWRGMWKEQLDAFKMARTGGSGKPAGEERRPYEERKQEAKAIHIAIDGQLMEFIQLGLAIFRIGRVI